MTVVAVLLSYLLGSVPFALLAARLKGVDLRAHGSGNLGATNAIRVLGAGVGVPVLLADVAKGVVAVLGFARLAPTAPEFFPLVCGVAAIVGHVYSMFLRFHGGKGVATAAGTFLAVAPAGFGIAILAFAVVFLASGYVSLASLVAATVLPVALWQTQASLPVFLTGVAIGLLVWLRHRTNLVRLKNGTESRVRFWKARRSK